MVFGPAALELLERACYPVPTPRLLNRNLFGVWNLTKVESILNLIVTNNGLVVLVYGTGELWNVPEKQKLRCVREVRGGGGAVRRIPSMTKMVTVSHLSHYQHPTTASILCLPGSFRPLTVAWATRHHPSCTTQVTTPGPKAEKGYRFPLPVPKMATRTSPPRKPHAPCSASAPLGLTGLLQVTVGSLRDGIPGSGGYTALSA